MAVARDGAIYAAAVGNKQAGSPRRRRRSPRPRAAAAAMTVTGERSRRPRARRRAPSRLRRRLAAPGGRERRQRSLPHRARRQSAPRLEQARRTWSMPSPSTPPGRVLLGTGNSGNVYRIESPTVYTSLLTLPADPDHRVPGGRRRAPVRRHRQCRQGVRDRTRPGARGHHRKRRFRRRHVHPVGPAEFRGQPERRPGMPSRRAAATWTSRRRTGALVAADHSPRARASPRPPRASCSGRPR